MRTNYTFYDITRKTYTYLNLWNFDEHFCALLILLITIVAYTFQSSCSHHSVTSYDYDRKKADMELVQKKFSLTEGQWYNWKLNKVANVY